MPKKKKTEEKEQPERLNFTEIKKGQYLSETQYYKVLKVYKNKLLLSNEREYEIEVERSVIEEGMFSASQYDEELKITRTEMSELLENAGDSVFTVNFYKQPKEKEINQEILNAIKDQSLQTDEKALVKKIKKAVKKAIKGEERILIGYLVHEEAKMGRSQVIDLEAKGDHRLRLVDHRSLNWLILKNKKYIIK